MKAPTKTETAPAVTVAPSPAEFIDTPESLEEAAQIARADFAGGINRSFKGWRYAMGGPKGASCSVSALAPLEALEAISGAQGIAAVLSTNTSTLEQDEVELLDGNVREALQDGLYACLKFARQYIEKQCTAAGVQL